MNIYDFVMFLNMAGIIFVAISLLRDNFAFLVFAFVLWMSLFIFNHLSMKLKEEQKNEQRYR